MITHFKQANTENLHLQKEDFQLELKNTFRILDAIPTEDLDSSGDKLLKPFAPPPSLLQANTRAKKAAHSYTTKIG